MALGNPLTVSEKQRISDRRYAIEQASKIAERNGRHDAAKVVEEAKTIESYLYGDIQN